jgi:sec-independent protein translocase protein TatB
MFDFFSWKLLIVLGVALVVVGPKDLPKFMHMIGRWLGKARAMANEFRRSFDEMARQTELDELRKEIEALKAKNPLADIQQSLNEPIRADAPVVSEPEPDEPRAGEFQITDTPVPTQAADTVASSSERAAS